MADQNLDEAIERAAIARSALSWELYTHPSDVTFAYFAKEGLSCDHLFEAAKQARSLGAFVLSFPSADAAAALKPTLWSDAACLLPEPWRQAVPFMSLRELGLHRIPLPPRLMLKQSRKGGCLLVSEIVARRGLDHFRYNWTFLQPSKKTRYASLPTGMHFTPHSSLGGIAGYLLSLDILPFEFNQRRVKSLYQRLEKWRAANAKDAPLPEEIQNELCELRQEIAWDPVASQIVAENARRRKAMLDLTKQVL